MELPFTVDQFFDVFARYNSDLPYAWAGLSGLALVGAAVAIPGFGRIPVVVLSVLWVWSGAVYHVAYFAQINPLATFFGIAFIIQGLLFLIYAANGARIEATPFSGLSKYTGAFFIVFALFIYPAIGPLFGHSFPRAPTFGLPCPLVIYTLGMMLWIDGRIPKHFMVLPLLWSVVGASASVLFGVWEDVSLLLAGVISAPMILSREAN